MNIGGEKALNANMYQESNDALDDYEICNFGSLKWAQVGALIYASCGGNDV